MMIVKIWVVITTILGEETGTKVSVFELRLGTIRAKSYRRKMTIVKIQRSITQHNITQYNAIQYNTI